MKVFKKLATLSMAVLMALGVSAFVACDKGGDGSVTSVESVESVESTTSETKTYTCYEFVVVNADGTKVGEGYQVQICALKEDGTIESCLRPIPVVNGVCVYNDARIKAPGIYEVHVVDEETNPIELAEVVRTSADAFGEYTLTLAE